MIDKNQVKKLKKKAVKKAEKIGKDWPYSCDRTVGYAILGLAGIGALAVLRGMFSIFRR